MKTALYLGRFQPFHLGHLDVVKKISKKYNKIIIAICSAQYSDTKRNPFSYVERWFMIDDTLKAEGISNYKILPVPDIHCYERWAEFCHSIYGDYDVVITNNPNTRELFENRGDRVEGYKYYTVTRYKYDAIYVNGTLVRELISKNDCGWYKLVPLSVRLYLTNINYPDRVRRLREIWKNGK